MRARRIGTLLVLLLAAINTIAQEAAVPDERTLAALLGREPSAAAVDENGWADLHHAAVLNLTALAATLLDAGAAPDAALSNDHEPFSERLQAVLAALGRDTFGKTHRYGQTPLHLAAREGSYDVAGLLIDRGANVDARDRAEDGTEDWSVLHYAVWFGALDVTRLLVERGAEVEARNLAGATPLALAAEKNAREAARLLIEHGAAVDAVQDDRRTPLHVAAEHDAAEVAELLIANGADVWAWSGSGWPLDHAVRNGARNAARLLVDVPLWTGQHGETLLHRASANGNRDRAVLLIDHGADVNAKDVYGSTPLHYALSKDAGTPELAKLLIDAGADVDARGEGGERPLHKAVRRLEALHLLLDEGAYPDYGDDLGRTPLHHAVAMDHAESVTALVRAGAEPDRRDDHGNTPLHHAVHVLSGPAPVQAAVRVLLDLGADPRVRNDEGLTFEEAVAHEAKPIEEGLKRLGRPLCDQYKKDDFSGMRLMLKNYGPRYLGRELTLEEIYPYLRCEVKSVEGLDLFQVSLEDISLEVAFHDLTNYFARRVEDKSLLGKILMCKRRIASNLYLNIFEYLEKKISNIHSSERVLQRQREFLRKLEYNFPEGRPECDPDFCRVYLSNPPSRC